MYNDEKNLYHYTYRKDGAEPTLGETLHAAGGQSGPRGPEWEEKPVKKNRAGIRKTISSA